MIAGTIIIITLLIFILFSIIEYQRRKELHQKEKEQMRVLFEQELLKAQLEIQEQTFENISQEIHDNIGQVLTLAKLNLSTVAPIITAPATDTINNTRELISKAISDLRNLSKGLNNQMIKDVGLLEAIKWECSILSSSGAIETTLSVSGNPFRFDDRKELIVFRIFQELINNTIKHSAATQLEISVQYCAEAFSLCVRDNGNGFVITSGSSEKKFGLGLRNMQSRAKLIQADFKINSSPGNGTTVEVSLPFN